MNQIEIGMKMGQLIFSIGADEVEKIEKVGSSVYCYRTDKPPIVISGGNENDAVGIEACLRWLGGIIHHSKLTITEK